MGAGGGVSVDARCEQSDSFGAAATTEYHQTLHQTNCPPPAGWGASLKSGNEEAIPVIRYTEREGK